MCYLKCILFLLCVTKCCFSHTYVNELATSDTKHVHCSHEHPKADDVIRGVHIEPAHLVKKRSIDQPLRISIFYDHSVYRLEPEKFDMINNTILPEAVKFWEEALKVRKTGGPIRLNRKCPTRQVFIRGGRSHCIDTCSAETMCGEVRVPEYHLNACYVCNSTGHNCRELIREKSKIESEVSANALNYGSEAIEKGEEDEEEQFIGVENTDFVLYVSAVETDRCRRGLTVAYASHCQQESALDRPVAGHANFCPGELSTKYRDLPSVLSTVKHEMLHALGFSVSLFGFYRDENGEPLTERRPDTGNPPLDEELQIHKWSDRVVKNITRNNWMIRQGYISRTFHMIVTPRVVREVRDHFNCSKLEGAELEDQGGDGTALTHWEKRVFENEAMTGTHTQNSVFSRITFAMMEDTGWYLADYDKASPLHWGKGLGCEFAMTSCKQWLGSQNLRYSADDNSTIDNSNGTSIDIRRNPAPFCERVKGDPLRTECSPHRTAVVLCNLVRHDTILPRQYQHFDKLPNIPPGDEAHYGGSVSLADYCPYLQEFTWKHKNVLIRGSRCSYEENTPKSEVNFALENYGVHSKCFDHSDRVWEQKSCRQIREWQHWGSGCYKYKCESGRIHIIVGNYTYTCYFAGQVLQVRIIQKGWLHRGGVVCPPCRELCGEEFVSRNEYCKVGEEAPPPNLYPNDVLACNAPALNTAAILLMSAILCTFYVSSTLTVQSYVLVQVRKDQNKSNVDALIHKVVPPKKFEEIADTARKQFKNFNQFTIRNNADDKELESIVFAIKTDEQNGGMKQDGRKQYGRLQDSGKHHKLEHLIVKLLSYFKSPGKKNLPYYKMQLQKFNIKSTGLSNSDRQWSNFSEPEIITFRNNEKPSMMYEIDTKSILKSFKETLASKRFKKFVDKVVDNAAVIYRAIKHEISDIKN